MPIADRVKFWSWTLFVAVWVTIVYFPVAHWVFSFDGFTGPTSHGGWIANILKAEDFAGGTAVHINAGAAALALAIVLGRRTGWPRESTRPHNLPFVLLGASLLWFGWYGFNAGSALSATDLAGLAFTNTTVAACAAVLGWLLVEQIRDGKPTALGAASGAVSGLVAITPACAFVTPVGWTRHRRGRRCAVRAGRGLEVPVRVRRLPRRGRCAPGRRNHRHPADRLPRHQEQSTRPPWARTACSTAAASSNSAAKPPLPAR